jgi:hypothetical protein
MTTANAIRKITAAMQTELESGRRSTRIDANDLIDVLLAIADEIDPPLGDRVDAGHACPGCNERRQDLLVWQDDDTVRCGTCGMNYVPGCPGR